MLTEKEIKEIINKSELTDIECIELIKQYIFDLRKVKVNINKPRNITKVTNMGFVNDLELMNDLYNYCVGYYTNKFINEKE